MYGGKFNWFDPIAQKVDSTQNFLNLFNSAKQLFFNLFFNETDHQIEVEFKSLSYNNNFDVKLIAKGVNGSDGQGSLEIQASSVILPEQSIDYNVLKNIPNYVDTSTSQTITGDKSFTGKFEIDIKEQANTNIYFLVCDTATKSITYIKSLAVYIESILAASLASEIAAGLTFAAWLKSLSAQILTLNIAVFGDGAGGIPGLEVDVTEIQNQVMYQSTSVSLDASTKTRFECGEVVVSNGSSDRVQLKHNGEIVADKLTMTEGSLNVGKGTFRDELYVGNDSVTSKLVIGTNSAAGSLLCDNILIRPGGAISGYTENNHPFMKMMFDVAENEVEGGTTVIDFLTSGVKYGDHSTIIDKDGEIHTSQGWKTYSTLDIDPISKTYSAPTASCDKDGILTCTKLNIPDGSLPYTVLSGIPTSTDPNSANYVTTIQTLPTPNSQDVYGVKIYHDNQNFQNITCNNFDLGNIHFQYNLIKVKLPARVDFTETVVKMANSSLLYSIIQDPPTIPSTLSQLTGTLPYSRLTDTPNLSNYVATTGDQDIYGLKTYHHTQSFQNIECNNFDLGNDIHFQANSIKVKNAAEVDFMGAIVKLANTTQPYSIISDPPNIPTSLDQLSGTLPYSRLTGTPAIPSLLNGIIHCEALECNTFIQKEGSVMKSQTTDTLGNIYQKDIMRFPSPGAIDLLADALQIKVPISFGGSQNDYQPIISSEINPFSIQAIPLQGYSESVFESDGTLHSNIGWATHTTMFKDENDSYSTPTASCNGTGDIICRSITITDSGSIQALTGPPGPIGPPGSTESRFDSGWFLVSGNSTNTFQILTVGSSWAWNSSNAVAPWNKPIPQVRVFGLLPSAYDSTNQDSANAYDLTGQSISPISEEYLGQILVKNFVGHSIYLTGNQLQFRTGFYVCTMYDPLAQTFLLKTSLYFRIVVF